MPASFIPAKHQVRRSDLGMVNMQREEDFDLSTDEMRKNVKVKAKNKPKELITVLNKSN